MNDTRQNPNFKYSIVLIALAVLVFAAASAHASILGDIWDTLKAPFSGGGFSSSSEAGATPKNTSAESPVPLYKPVIDYETAVVAAVKKASPAVVSITVSKNVPIIEQCPYNPFPDLPPEFRDFFGGGPQFYAPCEKGTKLQEVGGGSGFIVSSDGLVVTNKHVVSDAAAAYTVFTNDGKKYDAKVLARDPVQDIAILKISPPAGGFSTVTLGDSDAIELGQTAIAIGNALGEFRNTVSVGVISGLSRTITAGGGGVQETLQGVIQTDAAINPGNSGGPLLNLKGDVIGINTAVAQGAQSIGFAIPINRAKRDISSVKATGKIETPYIGVRYVMITPELAKAQKLPVERGALLRGSDEGPAVQKDSPAEKAGLQAEDIILEMNGKKIDAEHPLSEYVSQSSVGDTVTLNVNRGGKEMTVNVLLGKRPQE